MELEELKSKFNETLGSTKLQLSDRTLDGMLQDALAEIGDDDTRLTDEFIQRKISLAKTIEGQINHDVSERINDWKKQNPQPKPQPNGTKPEDDKMPAWFKAYKEESEAKIAALEQERENDRKKLEKNSILNQVKETLTEKFKAAGVEENGFILKQTLRDIEIPEEGADVNALAKEMEKAYYRNLKEAGLETDTPRAGSRGGQRGKNAADDFWAKKKAKEGWGKES